MIVIAFINAIGTLKATRILHKNLLTQVLRLPLCFFDVTPLGRILNRFSNDIQTTDVVLPGLLYMTVTMVFTVNIININQGNNE